MRELATFGEPYKGLMVRYSIDSILEFIFGIKREREREKAKTQKLIWFDLTQLLGEQV